MLEKLSFLALFLLDLYFTASGLLYLKTAGEAINALLFLILVWFVVWSLYKINSYRNNDNGQSFVRYYFNYLFNAVKIFGNERRLGPTKYFRLVNVFLSASVGFGVIIYFIIFNFSNVTFTQDLILRYAYVFFFVMIYPLVMYMLGRFSQFQTRTSFLEKILTFFPLKFTQLFIYLFTFLTPVAWFAVAFFSYIITKSTALNKPKPGETV